MPDNLPTEIDFLDCRIRWNNSTLLPRVETEFLPEHALPYLESGKVAWDICCGTGCIGLAIKKLMPSLHVTLSDIEPRAAALAKSNAELNNLDVTVLCGDLFEPFTGRCDYLFCNPPYVTELEYGALEPSVLNNEPKLALVSGPSGLEFYKRIQKEMGPYLNQNAKLFFEIGTGQGPALQKIFGSGQVIQDLAGHDRYFILVT
ncbi:MAG: peptide chain release factor N(5)-glutamine methyltransferase [Chlamydiia bacterium]|nr:peptide chain release factor N(5)-glutamine methyltransferase [Chlamydiia bacterium]